MGLASEGISSVVICNVIIQVDADSIVIVDDSAIVLAFVGISDAPIVVGPGIVWLEADRGIVLGDSKIMFAFLFVGDALFVVGLEILWRRRTREYHKNFHMCNYKLFHKPSSLPYPALSFG